MQNVINLITGNIPFWLANKYNFTIPNRKHNEHHQTKMHLKWLKLQNIPKAFIIYIVVVRIFPMLQSSECFLQKRQKQRQAQKILCSEQAGEQNLIHILREVIFNTNLLNFLIYSNLKAVQPDPLKSQILKRVCEDIYFWHHQVRWLKYCFLKLCFLKNYMSLLHRTASISSGFKSTF